MHSEILVRILFDVASVLDIFSLNSISIWDYSIIQHNKSLRLFGDIMAEKPFVLLIFKRSLAHYGIWCMLVCIGSDSDVAAVVEPRMMVYIIPNLLYSTIRILLLFRLQTKARQNILLLLGC